MVISEVIKTLKDIKSKYGDVEVTVSKHKDCYSDDFENDICFILYQDYENKKSARIFYVED